ncbi:ankyrin repeat-containing domain protein [Aspergillus bertholletiae]|uniref:Ankyrin repeat-containing domain protein n=1 Tax=Aspergillus bertholletiae TaxID=1226010 RepID=A0A5N7BHD5_9EURO|nr:ankyrin repeat-containing domain protein [Aspergillus bertholletiae]
MQTTSKLYPFLEYAVQYVLHHANTAAGDGAAQTSFLQEFPLSTWIITNNLFERHEIRRYTPAAQRMYILAERNYGMLLEAEIKLHHYVDARTERYDSPLMAAIMHEIWRYHAVRAVLLERGADVELRDIYNCTALSYAIEFSQDDAVKQLLDYGAEVESRGDHGSTPLCQAARLQYPWAVGSLLDKGANPEPRDDDGRVALSYAIEYGRKATVIQLLDSGADVNSRDNFGRTPLSYTTERLSGLGAVTIVQLLLKQGVDLQSTDEDGNTPLDHARRRGIHDVVMVLEKWQWDRGTMKLKD